MKKLIYICLAITLITFSCTIEKRMYNSGYHVKWNGKDFNSEKNSFSAAEDDKKEKITESKITNLDRNNSSKVEPSFGQPQLENTFSNATSFHSTLQKVAGEKRKSLPSKITSVQKENSIPKISPLKKSEHKSGKKSLSDDLLLICFILCFIIPPVAVGLITDWDINKVLLNLLLTILCGIPGIIHALIVVSDNR